jgi:hypothetical protein
MKQLSCAALTALLTVACGDDDPAAGSGALSVLLEAEDTITEGLDAGTEGENIQDGWEVRFDKYIVVIGDIDLHLATEEHADAESGAVFAVDLTTVPAGGMPLWELPDLREGRWDFNFSTPGAGDGAAPHSSVEQADFDAMAAADGTYLIVGTMTKADGQSCPPSAHAMPPAGAMPDGMNSGGDDCYANTSVAFNLLVPAETAFGPCEIDEVPGVAIAANSTTTVAVTIHGDHLFFNGFPEGDEGAVSRLAQWFADCDLNLDGSVTAEELETIPPADLPAIADYQLGGSPINPLEEMWDYVIAQLKTQGHFQGEGECPFDGMAHEHE